MPLLPPSVTVRLLGMPLSGAPPAQVREIVAGRTVVVTGGSRGVGAATAVRLAGVGAHVVLVARTETDLLSVVRRLRRGGAKADHLAVDLRDSEKARDAAETILARWGPPDVVVSNAGHSINRLLADYTDRFHDIARTTAINYSGPVSMLLGLLPAMTAARIGHLVNVSTTSVDVPAPGWSAYGASKAAFEAWLRAVAPELAAGGVATTSVHLPLVATAMSAPTRAMSRLPALTADQAAATVCWSLVHRPRLLAPWWATAAGVAMDLFPHAADAVMSRTVLRTTTERASR